MAHADYCFLHVVESDRWQNLADVKDSLQADLDRYAEDHCDDNNGYYARCAVLHDGRIVQFDSELDPSIKSFDDALRFAAGCVATEFQLWSASSWSFVHTQGNDAIEAASYKELVDAIWQEAPQRIVHLYTELATRARNGEADEELGGYRRRMLVGGFELFASSFVPPFATERKSPYDYRCYDLREYPSPELSEHTAILIADFHT